MVKNCVFIRAVSNTRLAKYMGFRPGEKMFEELVLGTSLTQAASPRTSMTQGAFLENRIFEGHKTVLEKAMRTGDAEGIKAELSSMNILVQN